MTSHRVAAAVHRMPRPLQASNQLNALHAPRREVRGSDGDSRSRNACPSVSNGIAERASFWRALLSHRVARLRAPSKSRRTGRDHMRAAHQDVAGLAKLKAPTGPAITPGGGNCLATSMSGTAHGTILGTQGTRAGGAQGIVASEARRHVARMSILPLLVSVRGGRIIAAAAGPIFLDQAWHRAAA